MDLMLLSATSHIPILGIPIIKILSRHKLNISNNLFESTQRPVMIQNVKTKYVLIKRIKNKLLFHFKTIAKKIREM